MGQARLKGNFEERKAKALARDRAVIEEYKAKKMAAHIESLEMARGSPLKDWERDMVRATFDRIQYRVRRRSAT